MKNSTPPIDLEDVLERTGDDMEFLRELLLMYQDDFQGKCRELETAIDNKDFSTVRDIGHYIKGSSANLSLPRLKEAAYSIEKAGAEGHIEEARFAFRQLRDGFAGLERYLKEVLFAQG